MRTHVGLDARIAASVHSHVRLFMWSVTRHNVGESAEAVRVGMPSVASMITCIVCSLPRCARRTIVNCRFSNFPNHRRNDEQSSTIH